LALQDFRAGNYGPAVVYALASFLDSGIGLATFGLSARLTAAARELTAAAREGLRDLSAFRQQLGLAPATLGATTLSRLEIADRVFYGISAHGQEITFSINAVSATHAEADAFQQAINAGVRSPAATLYIDNVNGLCGYCRTSGIISMMRASGVEELTVVTPSGVVHFP
jgi:hypothetical protein